MARKLVAFSTLLALIPFATAQTASPWAQCGGQGWTGATTCPSGWDCVKSNDWYSQCLPSSTTTTPTTSTITTSCPSTVTTTTTRVIIPTPTCSHTLTITATPTPFAKRDVGPYGQCGGQGWTGSTVCTSGYACVATNPYYSQCQPASSSASTTANCPQATTITRTMTITATASCVPGTVTVTILPTGTSTTATATATPSGLHAIAKSVGKLYFGSATDNPELSDAPYKAKLSDNKEFGIITPGNSMKWDATEPSRGSFSFSGGDAIVALAKANGQMVRGHTTVWHSQLPSWVTSGNFDNATLISIVKNHVTNVVSHYKGDIYAWDVVNEIFNDDGTWRTSVFYNTIGPEFVPIAFQAARAADPNAKLYINDYNIDGTGAKSTAVYNLVKSLKERGIPIDGIGLQGHLIVGALPSTIQQNIEQFTSLGVEVAFTELDIRMNTPATDAQLQQQKKDYQSVVGACKAVPKCIGVTVWDWTDKYSWIPSVFSGQGAALPWDDNFVKKPAYDGIVAGLTQ